MFIRVRLIRFYKKKKCITRDKEINISKWKHEAVYEGNKFYMLASYLPPNRYAYTTNQSQLEFNGLELTAVFD